MWNLISNVYLTFTITIHVTRCPGFGLKLSVCGQWMLCNGKTVRMRSLACAFAGRTNLPVLWSVGLSGLVLLILDILHPVQFCIVFLSSADFLTKSFFFSKNYFIFQKYYHVISVNQIEPRSGPTLRRTWSGSKLFTNRQRLSAFSRSWTADTLIRLLLGKYSKLKNIYNKVERQNRWIIYLIISSCLFVLLHTVIITTVIGLPSRSSLNNFPAV